MTRIWMNHWFSTAYNIVNLIKTYDKESLKNRYKELSEGILSEDSIYLKFSNYIVDISSTVKNADAEKWKIISGTLTNNLEQILNYYKLNKHRRFYYYDQLFLLTDITDLVHNFGHL